jgi:group II intron reverse transcriptase/maturase
VTVIGLAKHGVHFFSFFIPSGTPVALVRAPNEGASFMNSSPDSFAYSIYLDANCGYSPPFKLKSYWDGEAEYKYIENSGLPLILVNISRNSHVEVNKPDTYKRPKAVANILSRICRYCFSIAIGGGTNSISCRKAERYPYIGIYCEQAAKTVRTLNTTRYQLRDSTASILFMRKRSFHSSIYDLDTKGNSSISSPSEVIDSDFKKPATKVKPVKVAKRVGVTTIAMEKMKQVKKENQKYYDLLKILADPYFLVSCHEEISDKKGNMTPGSDGYTLDGISWDWFVKIADLIRKGHFSFQPSRRVEIPKTDGRKRPLGIGSPRDKIVQKGLHALLEGIYEPLFLSSSHGFRPKRSVHSALLRVYLIGNKHNWVIQGDITKCFDSIPHDIIMTRIKKQIGDPRILELLHKYLNAGYVDPNTNKIVFPSVGTPQGGILSPLLCNIVLHEFDSFMEKLTKQYKSGETRRINPVYKRLSYLRYKSTSPETRKELLDAMRKTPRSLRFDSKFRRLEYIRYADDFIIFVSGSLKDSEYIKSNIVDFLKVNCGLDLNKEKTVISNLKSNSWHFLGAEIKKIKTNSEWRVNHLKGTAVGVPKILVKAPIEKIVTKLKASGFLKQNKLGKILPIAYTPLVNLSHYEILTFFNSKIRGLLNFYSFSSNRYSLSWPL